MKIEKRCEACGELFKVDSNRKDTAKTCSIECKGKLKTIKSKPHITCVACGKTVNVMKPYLAKTQKTCSLKCKGVLQSINWQIKYGREYAERRRNDKTKKSS